MNKIWILTAGIVALISWGTYEARHGFETRVKEIADQRKQRLDRLEALQMGRAYQVADDAGTKGSKLEDFHMGRNDF